jgi:CheY-like chemotaxis protein
MSIPALCATAVRVAPTKHRVLLIEDNVDAAESMRDALELDGYVVALAFDGSDGIAMARAFHPDLVLCDIGLPGMDGYDVARAFRADTALCRVRLVAVTGYAQPEDVARALAAGFDEHLGKPASMQRLRKALAFA